MSGTQTADEPCVLGVDLGGVVIARSGNQDTSFWGDRPMETPAVPDAARTLAVLNAGLSGRVHLISQAHERVEGLTRQWLDHTRFWDETGIDRGHLHFVRERPDKAPVCLDLSITHFVDDSLDVLEHLASVRRRYWFAPRPESTAVAQQWAIPVGSWPELHSQLAQDACMGPSAALGRSRLGTNDAQAAARTHATADAPKMTL